MRSDKRKRAEKLPTRKEVAWVVVAFLIFFGISVCFARLFLRDGLSAFPQGTGYWRSALDQVAILILPIVSTALLAVEIVQMYRRFQAVRRERSVSPRGHPDEERARRDFLTEHPSYIIDRVILHEREAVAVSVRIFYRIPGDPSAHVAFREYLHDAWGWRLLP